MKILAVLLVSIFLGSPLAQAQTSQVQPNTLDETAIGVKIRNGEILLGAPVVGFDGYDAGLRRLLMLLLLKSNPEVFNQPESTLAYVQFINAARQRSYVSENGQWRGRDQFERDDARAAFMRNERAAIFSLIPRLPLTLVELRPFGFGEYDRDTGTLALELDSHDPLPSGPWVMPRPYSFPNSLQVPEQGARQLVRQQTERQNSPTDRLTAAARYTLREVRFVEGRVVLDIAALDLIVYGSRRLDTKITSIPLPASAVKAAPARDDGQSTPLLDSIFPRLMLVKSRPNLLDNSSFVAETFRIRRQIEGRIARGFRFNGFDETTNWPAVMSATMLNTNATPSDTELRNFRGWIEKAAASISDTVRIERICRYSGPPTAQARRCNVTPASSQPGKTTFRLRDLLDFSAFDWGYAGGAGDWVTPARKAATESVPDSIATSSIPSGNDVPTIIVASGNPAWIEFVAPFDLANIASLSLDLAIKRVDVVADASGRLFQLVELDPKMMNYRTRAGAEGKLPIVSAAAVAAADESGQLDVLGVKLGMPMKDAIDILAKNINLGQLKRADENRPNDPVFMTAAVFEHRPDGKPRVQKISLFYDRSRQEQPVVAIGRYFSLEDQNFRDAESARKSIVGSVSQKFGPPDQGSFKSNDLFYWAIGKVMKATLKAEMAYDHRCSHSKFRNFFERPGDDSMFRSSHVAAGCGEVLSAYVYRDKMAFFLFNGDVADRMRRAAAAQATPTPAPPPIKF